MKNQTASGFRFVSRSVRLLPAAAAAALAFAVTPASAACVGSASVTCDATKIQAFHGNSAYNYGGPGFVAPGRGDVLQGAGHPFDTDRVEVSVTHSAGKTTLGLKFYTSFNGNDLSARYADIFIGNNNATLAGQNSFGYAVTVGDELANGGKNSVGFYDVSAPGSSKTSIDIWQSRTGYIYGGQFEGTDALLRASPVVVTNAASLVSNFTANVATGASGDASYPYLLDMTLSASTTDFNALFASGISVFWGTGDCSNDAIQALIAYTPRNVPEPVTLSLFAAGMAGMAAMRRRKAAKSA